MFALVGRAVTLPGTTQGNVATLAVEVGVKRVRSLEAGFFKRGKSSAVEQQSGFEGAIARLRLGRTRQCVVAGITEPAKAGYDPGLCDAGAASGTRALAAAVGVDNQTQSQLAQRQSLFQRVEY